MASKKPVSPCTLWECFLPSEVRGYLLSRQRVEFFWVLTEDAEATLALWFLRIRTRTSIFAHKGLFHTGHWLADIVRAIRLDLWVNFLPSEIVIWCLSVLEDVPSLHPQSVPSALRVWTALRTQGGTAKRPLRGLRPQGFQCPFLEVLYKSSSCLLFKTEIKVDQEVCELTARRKHWTCPKRIGEQVPGKTPSLHPCSPLPFPTWYSNLARVFYLTKPSTVAEDDAKAHWSFFKRTSPVWMRNAGQSSTFSGNEHQKGEDPWGELECGGQLNSLPFILHPNSGGDKARSNRKTQGPLGSAFEWWAMVFSPPPQELGAEALPSLIFCTSFSASWKVSLSLQQFLIMSLN